MGLKFGRYFGGKNFGEIQSFSQTFASILTRFAQLYMSPQNACYNPQLRFENDRYPQNKYSNSFEESNQIE